MKIAHTADLHLGKKISGSQELIKKRYLDFFDRFEELADYVIENDIRVLIIAGDLFDKKELSAEVLEKTEKILHKIKNDGNKKRDIDIIVCEGNHDIYRNENESWLYYLKNKGLILFNKYNPENIDNSKYTILGINFYIVGYQGFLTDNILTELSKKLNPSEKNIIITHTAIVSDFNLPGLVKAETIKQFEGKVIYIAGGHIHSHSKYPNEKPYFFVPGSLEFANFYNEGLEEKSFIVFDTDNLSLKKVPINNRKRIKTEIFRYDNIENIGDEFKKFLKKYSLSGEELLVVKILAIPGDYINKNMLREISITEGAMDVYIKIIYENLYLNNNIYDEDMKLIDLENDIIKSWNIFKDYTKFTDKFTILKNYQLEEKKDEFIDLLDNILDNDEIGDIVDN